MNVKYLNMKNQKKNKKNLEGVGCTGYTAIGGAGVVYQDINNQQHGNGVPTTVCNARLLRCIWL